MDKKSEGPQDQFDHEEHHSVNEVVDPQSVHQVNDVTDSVEQHPNVEFGLLEMVNREMQNQTSPNHADADQIWNTGDIGDSSHGTSSYLMNVLGQFIDGTAFASNPASSSCPGNVLDHDTGAGSSLEMMSHHRNVLGQGPGGTRPVSHPASSSLGTMSHHGNVLGQGTGGTRPVLQSRSLSLEMMSRLRNLLVQGTGGTRPVLQSGSLSLERMSHLRNLLGQGTGGTRPVSHPASSSRGGMSHYRSLLDQGIGATRHESDPASLGHGTMSHRRNVLSQGTGGTQPMCHHGNVLGQCTGGARPASYSASLGLGTGPVLHSENPGDEMVTFIHRNGQEFVRVQLEMPISGQDIVEARVVVSPLVVQVIRSNRNIACFPTPRPVHNLILDDQYMRMQFTPGPPMVEMRPSEVYTIPPMVPTRPTTNIHMAAQSGGGGGGEHGARIGKASYSGAPMSRTRSEDTDEHGSASRDAKRSKR